MTSKAQQQEAKEMIRKFVKPGGTVYTVIRSVSRSGMSRCMDAYAFYLDDKGRIQKQYLTGWLVALGIGSQSRSMWEKSAGMRVNGCGMDMGFHVVDSLNYALGYTNADRLNHEWI